MFISVAGKRCPIQYIFTCFNPIYLCARQLPILLFRIHYSKGKEPI